jgi:hypothetical protein
MNAAFCAQPISICLVRLDWRIHLILNQYCKTRSVRPPINGGKIRFAEVGDPALWVDSDKFKRALNGNPIKVLTLKEMVAFIAAELTKLTDGKKTRAPASTDI